MYLESDQRQDGDVVIVQTLTQVPEACHTPVDLAARRGDHHVVDRWYPQEVTHDVTRNV